MSWKDIPLQRRIEIEKGTIELRDELNLFVPCIPVLQIPRRLGIQLICYSSLQPSAQAHIRDAHLSDAFSLVGTSRFGPNIIFYNDMQFPLTRRLFSVAHEIMHIWLGHVCETSQEEAEADYGAGYLLAPHPYILRYGLTASSMQSIFHIGEHSAKFAFDQAWDRSLRLQRDGRRLPHEVELLERMPAPSPEDTMPNMPWHRSLPFR